MNLVKDENDDLVVDPHNSLNRWKKYFCQLLNVHGVNDVWQTEMHAAQSLVPESSHFEVEITTEKLKRYKLPGTDKILAELIKAEGNTYHSAIHKLSNYSRISVTNYIQNFIQYSCLKVNSIHR